MATIEFLEGPMGNGKSLLANIRALECLNAGGVVGLNYPLAKDWAYKHALHMRKRWHTDKQFIADACSYHERLYRYGTVESLEELARILPRKVTGKMAKRYEDKGLVVFDEASLFFNSRDWKNNMGYIKFFINSRKHKFQCIMVSHAIEDVDSQIQRKVELITSCRNMQKRKFLGIPIAAVMPKKAVFRTISIVGGRGAAKGVVEDKDSFRYNEHVTSLYDSDHKFDLDDADRGLELIGTDPREIFEKEILREKYEKLIKVQAATVLPAGYFA